MIGVGPIFLILIVFMGLFGLYYIFPLVQRLTEAFAKRIEGGGARDNSTELIKSLEESVRTLEGQVGALEEQQQFLEKLLADRKPPALPPAPDNRSDKSPAT